jgi:hypothetical protein
MSYRYYLIRDSKIGPVFYGDHSLSEEGACGHQLLINGERSPRAFSGRALREHQKSSGSIPSRCFASKKGTWPLPPCSV